MKYKILIVDDEEAARYGMRKALQSKENLLLEASDLRMARFIVEKEEPALVLLDVNLPDGSGIDFLKEVAGRADRTGRYRDHGPWFRTCGHRGDSGRRL